MRISRVPQGGVLDLQGYLGGWFVSIRSHMSAKIQADCREMISVICLNCQLF